MDLQSGFGFITLAEAKAIAPVIGGQSIQGFFIGILPGAGATIASFLGYTVERNIAPKHEQDEFGKGSIKGLAAPETANNAACTGSFVPLLTLGIPGSGTTAILLGALIALNVSPGPRLMIDEPQIFWVVIMLMFIGFILSEMMEDNFARSMQLYDGISFIWERPMTLGLLVIAAILQPIVRDAHARRSGVWRTGIDPCHH